MQVFKAEKKKQGLVTIPHFHGGNSTPCFPPLEQYAKATLLIHKPWTNENHLNLDNCFEEFANFICSSECPSSVKIPFFRVKDRFIKGKTFVEPVSKMIPLLTPNIEDTPIDLIEAIEVARTIALPQNQETTFDLDFGLNFDWSKCQEDFSDFTTENVLEKNALFFQKSHSNNSSNLPTKLIEKNGKFVNEFYELHNLTDDQQNVAFQVLSTIKEFVENLLFLDQQKRHKSNQDGKKNKTKMQFLF